MYVSLLVHGAPRLRPDLFAVVQESMRNGRRDGREREAVGYSEDCREEERAVLLVLHDIKAGIVVDDLGHVIRVSETVERRARGDSVGTHKPGRHQIL